jgi:hypothetical protein
MAPGAQELPKFDHASLQNEHSFFILDDTIAVSPVAAHN